MSNKQNRGSANGKGYYIALILCAVAIGICGYMYYRNANDVNSQLDNPEASVGATLSDGEQDVQAVATQPQSSETEGNSPSTQNTKPKSLKTASPVEGQTVAAYAMDYLSYNQTTRDWRTHDGVDIAAEAGTQVCAAAEGTVYTVYEDETMGMTVVISHDNGYTTKYASLDQEVLVAPGDEVALGQAIGCVGQTALLESATGDHVHFSVTCDGEAVDPAEFQSQE